MSNGCRKSGQEEWGGGMREGVKGQSFLHCLPLPVYHTLLSTLNCFIARIADASFLCGKTPCQFNLVYNPKPSWLDLPYLLWATTIHARPLSIFLLENVFSFFLQVATLFPNIWHREEVILHICSGTSVSLEDILRSCSIMNRLFSLPDSLLVSEADCPLIFGELK